MTRGDRQGNAELARVVGVPGAVLLGLGAVTRGMERWVLLGLGAAGIAFTIAVGPAAGLGLAHLHNVVALALWWAWRPRPAHAALVPAAVVAGAAVLAVLETKPATPAEWARAAALLADTEHVERGITVALLSATDALYDTSMGRLLEELPVRAHGVDLVAPRLLERGERADADDQRQIGRASCRERV